MIHNPLRNLLVSVLLVLAPLGGATARLAHPAPWIALVAAWLTCATAPQLGPRRMVGDGADRLSALAILLALVAGLVVGVVDFGYRAELRPAPASGAVFAGALVAAGGLALRIWSIRTLGRFFTATVNIAPDQQVVESGPYRVLRHPSYIGAMLTILGLALAFASAAAAAVTLAMGTPAYLYRIAIEERALVAELGDAYRAYRARTWRLVPFVY